MKTYWVYLRDRKYHRVEAASIDDAIDVHGRDQYWGFIVETGLYVPPATHLA